MRKRWRVPAGFMIAVGAWETPMPAMVGAYGYSCTVPMGARKLRTLELLAFDE